MGGSGPHHVILGGRGHGERHQVQLPLLIRLSLSLSLTRVLCSALAYEHRAQDGLQSDRSVSVGKAFFVSKTPPKQPNNSFRFSYLTLRLPLSLGYGPHAGLCPGVSSCQASSRGVGPRRDHQTRGPLPPEA